MKIEVAEEEEERIKEHKRQALVKLEEKCKGKSLKQMRIIVKS